jgi:uncharacterized lipoprotein YddW (UPF0748 family)
MNDNLLAKLSKFLVSFIITISLMIIFWQPSTYSTQPHPSPATEVRGVWLTNVASGVLFIPWGINRAINTLAQLNFNTIYPVVWNRGYTFYPSTIAQRVTGNQQDPLLATLRGNSDLLADIIKQGKAKGLSVIPWFEYGFIIPGDSNLVKHYPHWITQSRDQQTQLDENKLEEKEIVANNNPSNFFAKIVEKLYQNRVKQQVWLNPFHPEVQDFIQNLIIEVVTKYDVEGIQLDDHFGLPVELGYDPYTIRLYQQQYQKKPPDNPLDPQWMAWRANKLTDFVATMVKNLKEVKPTLKIVLSPNSQSFSYQNYLQDWQKWVKLGLIDELILQVYRHDLDSFIKELEQPAVKLALSKIPVSVGILTGTLTRPIDFEQIKSQIETVRQHHFKGVSFFYWESLWGYITPESPRQRRNAFHSLFADPSLRPNFK